MSTSWELLLLGATGSNKRSDSLASSGQVCPVDAFNADDISSPKKEESVAGTSERWQQTRRYVKELVASNQHGKAKDMLLNLVTKANLVAPIEQVVTSDAALPLEKLKGAATMIATTVLPLSTGELSTVESDFANIDGTTTMANMQVSMLRLTDSQDMYLQAASRLFICLDLDVSDLIGWIPTHSIPYLLLSINRDEYTDKLQHPFLLYSRFMLRKYMKTCLVPESERDLVAQCAKIVEGAVDTVTSSSPHSKSLKMDRKMESPVDGRIIRDMQIIPVMLFELAMYNFIVDKPAVAVNWFQALWAHKNGLLSDTTTKGRIDVVLARKVEKMCSQACAHISRTDTWTADTALAQMHSFGRFSESLNDLVGAAITKSSPILCRRIMARIFAKAATGENRDLENHASTPHSFMLHFICNALSVLLDTPIGDAKAELFPEFMGSFNSGTILDRKMCISLLDTPLLFTRHPEFSRLMTSDAEVFNGAACDLYLFLYLNSNNTVWCEMMEAHEFYAPIFSEYPFLKLKRQLRTKSIGPICVSRAPRSESVVDQELFLQEMLLSRIQITETKYIPSLNSVIGKHPVATCTLIARSVEKFVEDEEFDQALSLLEIAFVLVENSPQPPHMRPNLEQIRRKCYHCMLIGSIKSMDENDIRKVETGISGRIITTLETCGLPDRDEFVKLMQALLHKSSANILVECTKSFTIYASNNNTAEAYVFVIVSRVAAFMIAALSRVTDNSMFTSIYPSNESPGTDLLSEQAIVEVHAFANHLAVWLTDLYGSSNDTTKAIHSILLDIIQGYDDAQHAFFLLVGCVGGVLASYQTPDLRYSLQSMGPFAMCCSPVLKDTLPKSEKRVAQIIVNSKLLDSASSANPTVNSTNTPKKLGIVETQLLDDFLEQICLCWTKLESNTSPIPYWVLGGIAYVRSRSSTTPSSTAPPTTPPSLAAVKTEQHRTVKRCYLNGILVVSQDLYRIDLLDSVWQSNMLNQLIESCITLEEHINVAFLSQLMPRIDYKLSFRALREIQWDQLDLSGYTSSSASKGNVPDLYSTTRLTNLPELVWPSIPFSCFWDMSLVEFVVFHLDKNGHEDIAQALITQHVRNPNMTIGTLDTSSKREYIHHIQQTHLTKMVLELGTMTR
ncbi:hypothetical protein BASA60_003493 [Batrachochytrium salamandrivorans]|nr:hypothetical protein BASA60_003493 [Batrachochytrium salamandrivorans]KAH9252801.1 hypothetical protein BASA81_009205 [Batrachochytrium salamandrivorans]KAH9265132.1 hypothetical protein BASA83_011363 [Batrachochytrium salamandrivorans]